MNTGCYAILDWGSLKAMLLYTLCLLLDKAITVGFIVAPVGPSYTQITHLRCTATLRNMKLLMVLNSSMFSLTHLRFRD